METRYKLRLTGHQHEALFSHLLPGDGLEAVSLALCGVSEMIDKNEKKRVILVHEIHHIPYSECSVRRPDRVTWSTAVLQEMMQKATQNQLIVLKIHSHPNGLQEFSEVDDSSDKELYESLSGWLQHEFPLISAVMLPEGRVFARVWESTERPVTVESILIAGDNISIWHSAQHTLELSQDHFQKRTEQTFGKGTTSLLSRLSVGVVGVSGTGSPVVEMLYRLGVGHLVIVDDDVVEARNVGRIYNSTMQDAETNRFKVDVMSRAIENSHLPTKVTCIPKDLYDESSIRYLAQCDIVFGCMDSVDGRDLLNKLSVFYLLPYFDVGVHLDADGTGGLNIASGAVQYVLPDGPTLLERKAYTSEQLRESYLKRANPQQYKDLLDEGYIKGVREDRPAVISLNTLASSLAVNDLLARLHGYRWFPNSDVGVIRINLSDLYIQYESAPQLSSSLRKFIGLGDVQPLLREFLIK